MDCRLVLWMQQFCRKVEQTTIKGAELARLYSCCTYAPGLNHTAAAYWPGPSYRQLQPSVEGFWVSYNQKDLWHSPPTSHRKNSWSLSVQFWFPRQRNNLPHHTSSKLALAGKPRKIRTFHGRLCICDLGTNGTKFCSWSSCGICAIIRSAFDTFEFEIKSNSGRSV